jgi:hypothetical protein
MRTPSVRVLEGAARLLVRKRTSAFGGSPATRSRALPPRELRTPSVRVLEGAARLIGPQADFRLRRKSGNPLARIAAPRTADALGAGARGRGVAVGGCR